MVTSTLDRQIRLAEAAQRYYVDGWSQGRIAEHLGTTRSNVSRLLDTARREDVVRFVVDHPLARHPALEVELRAAFGVQEAIVTREADPTLGLIGRLAASRLVEFLEPGGRIAIGWGLTVQSVVEHIAVRDPLNVEVVQIGGDLTMAAAASGHELVRRLSDALGGRHRFLHAPALLESDELAAGLRSDPRISAELERASRAQVALIGIGVPGVELITNSGTPTQLGEAGAAAVVGARIVDHTGSELNGPHRHRVIAIQLDDLRAIPTTIAVAGGTAKGGPIAAALRGGFIDILVCDQAAAATALEHTAQGKAGHATT